MDVWTEMPSISQGAKALEMASSFRESVVTQEAVPRTNQAGEKAIVCDQCGAQFQTEESLEAHRQIHTGGGRSSVWLMDTVRGCDVTNTR
ncbi:hypothetical protein INR49_027635 [Caranx melampygus]|nr:hypothetical protein INR49_027635 [Caranx melampygus]